MKKKIILSIICSVLVLGCLTGCETNWYKENIEETYRDYWNYSLGNYEVTYEVDDDNGSNGSGGLIINKWYNYTFAFKDINNNSRDITISNYNIKDFNDKIAHAAASLLAEDVKNIFKNHSFQKIDGVNTFFASSSCDVQRINNNINLYDTNNGLKFNELNLNTLSKNNINVEIHTTVELDGAINDYPALKEKLLNDVKFIFENYEYSNIKFHFTVKPSDDWYSTEYYLNYNGYNYNWVTKYNGEEQ